MTENIFETLYGSGRTNFLILNNRTRSYLYDEKFPNVLNDEIMKQLGIFLTSNKRIKFLCFSKNKKLAVLV